MAAVIPGPGTPSGGSVGTLTYGRNRYGAYARNRTKPVNPNSPMQTRARQIFNAAIAAWQALTSVQRAAWENWAALTPWLNRAGETVHLTGAVAFGRHYMAQMQLTYPAAPASGFLEPPVQNDVGSINVTGGLTNAEYDVATGAIGFEFNAPGGATNTWAVTGGILLVEMTPGQNDTRRFSGSRWSGLYESGSQIATAVWTAGVVTVSASTNPSGNPLAFPYGLSLGQLVWFRVRGVSPVADRRVTEKVQLGPYVVAAPTP